MDQSAALAVLFELAARQCGVFRGAVAERLGVSRAQLMQLARSGLIRRELPDTYRLTAMPLSDEQRLRASLLWAGAGAAGEGRSAGWWYGIEGARACRPEIVVLRPANPRNEGVGVLRVDDVAPLMIRSHRGIRVTGPEATLVRLAHLLDEEALEIACEDARRRNVTSMPAIYAYLDRYARRGQRGVAGLRSLLRELDPVHPSRSTLEVKTRRLLVANGFTDFVREHPLDGANDTYFFDFAFLRERTILETNGKRFHDDPIDYEHDNEKWSVPGRHGFKLVFATWHKVTRRSDALLAELRATLAA
jgi:very-short-patch-repair endonuclease